MLPKPRLLTWQVVFKLRVFPARDSGSSITGELVAQQASPKRGSAPWLLLKVTSHQGKGEFDRVTFMRWRRAAATLPIGALPRGFPIQ